MAKHRRELLPQEGQERGLGAAVAVPKGQESSAQGFNPAEPRPVGADCPERPSSGLAEPNTWCYQPATMKNKRRRGASGFDADAVIPQPFPNAVWQFGRDGERRIFYPDIGGTGIDGDRLL